MSRMIKSLAFAAALASSQALAEQSLPPAGAPDVAKVTTLVSSIPMAVDRAAYDLAQAAFAPEIVIDYTSLWGGEPLTTTPAELMASWRGIVPGFDATWHQLGPVTVEIVGDAATATAFVDGRHWIGEELWRPIGDYHWDLARVDGRWVVTRMVFSMTQELGDRAVAMKAMKRATNAE